MEPMKRLYLLEMEKMLAGPDREAALARFDEVLLGLQKRLDAAMDGGLPPEEFSRAASLVEANTLARKLLRLAVREAGTAQETQR